MQYKPTVMLCILLSVLLSLVVFNIVKRLATNRTQSSSKMSIDFNESQKLFVYSNSKLTASPSQVDSRSLVLLFGWLSSEDKHLEKYRQIYYRKGFDVLTIRTRLLDVLVPHMGSERVANEVVDFLGSHRRYDNLAIHLFSVGSYQLGEDSRL